MRLSEAILLGSMVKPQGFGSPFRGKDRSERLCALEAAAYAIGVSYQNVHALLFAGCPWGVGVSCPSCQRANFAVVHLVAHLNDQHRWTRQRIAGWVETIELRPSDVKVTQEESESPINTKKEYESKL